MKYDQTIITPKGLAVHIRNGVASDGSTVLENFNLALSQVKKFVQHQNSISAICNSTMLLLHEKVELL